MSQDDVYIKATPKDNLVDRSVLAPVGCKMVNKYPYAKTTLADDIQELSDNLSGNGLRPVPKEARKIQNSP